MTEYTAVASTIEQALNLKHGPVAISFVDKAPSDIKSFEGNVSAGCVFWQKAFTKQFTTTPKDHENCSIGVHTHNMAETSDNYTTELTNALGAMSGLDYVREEEVAQIPVLTKKTKNVVYGPLRQLSIKADLVLLFVTANQGLILAEAIARVDKSIPLAMGRPACAVIPQVSNQNTAAMSLGCCGARAYLDDLSDDVSMWALPADKIEAYAQEIKTLASANSTLFQFHTLRKQDIDAGKKPTVAQSLERLS